VITITRTSDGKVLATATTSFAPKYQTSQTSGTVQATVTDIGNNTSPTNLTGVRVTLTPPSGLSPAVPPGPESDTTDSGGTVYFPALTPTSGSQNYSIGIASADLPALYYQIPVSSFQLAPTQVLPVSIQVYQPVTLYVALKKLDGSAFTGTATIVVTAGSGGTSWTFTHTYTAADYPGGWAITTQGPSSTTPLLPNLDYAIAVTATNYYEADDDDLVPVSGVYPATTASQLSDTFTETMVGYPPGGEIDVTVQMNKTSAPTSTLTCHNASVVVSGGPNASLYTNYTVSTGNTSPYTAKFPNGTYPHIVTNIAPYNTTQYSIKATTAGGVTQPATLLSGVAALPTKTPVTINLGNTTNSSC
jgi:hypothetical protein